MIVLNVSLPPPPMKVLVSFYNPNRLSVVLEQGSASFIYKEQTVGQWIATKPLFFEAGSITDVRFGFSDHHF